MEFNMDHSIGFLLNRTALASKNCFNQLIKSYGISPEQWSVIYRVVEKKGISQKELADSTYKDQGNLTRMIDKLVEKGFLTKSTDEEDRRAYKLSATEKALELSTQIIPITSAHNTRLTEDLSEEETLKLIELLNKVYNNMQRKH